MKNPPQHKLAIVTRADGNIKNMTDITLPVMREYAKKCGADFKILSHKPQATTWDKKDHYRILKCQDFKKHAKRNANSVKSIKMIDNWARLKTIDMCVI